MPFGIYLVIATIHNLRSPMEFSRRIIEALQFQPWPRQSWRWPRLQSHRGYWLEGQAENSLASLEAAKLKGFEMAEFDVRLSIDGVAVLSHDKISDHSRKLS